MTFPIKGFQKTTMIDYPGKIASVVFLGNCNFRCPYCQNRDLILNTHKMPSIEHKEIFDYLEAKKKWIDGICISGGEPTIHKGLPDFCRQLKSKGILVKLDTNGTSPEMLELLLKEKLVDFVAMDIKAPLDKYEIVAETSVNTDNIRKSVGLIKDSDVDYEFRTTVLPKLLNMNDLKAIGEWLKGSKKYVLQQFRAMNTLDKKYENEPAYSEDEMKRFGEMLKPYFETVEVRL